MGNLDCDYPKLAELLISMKNYASTGKCDLKDQNYYERPYFARCKRSYIGKGGWGMTLILTRDTGHHTCGWWKNPDYEACVHLSLSFWEFKGNAQKLGHLKRDRTISDYCVEQVFGPTKNLVWAEPPYSPQGKAADVWRYRVFCDPTFAVPILPRGEVYTKAFTEAGWLSWSDYQEAQKQKKEEG